MRAQRQRMRHTWIAVDVVVGASLDFRGAPMIPAEVMSESLISIGNYVTLVKSGSHC